MLCVHSASIDHCSLASAWMPVKPRFSVLASQAMSALNRREKNSEFQYVFPQAVMLCTLLSGFSMQHFLFEPLTDCTSTFLLLLICQSEMTVALCQTSYASDWNPFTFHLQLIIFSFLCCFQDEPVHSSHFTLEHIYLLHVSDVQGLNNNLWDST